MSHGRLARRPLELAFIVHPPGAALHLQSRRFIVAALSQAAGDGQKCIPIRAGMP
jgi:hypothetical protein